MASLIKRHGNLYPVEAAMFRVRCTSCDKSGLAVLELLRLCGPGCGRYKGVTMCGRYVSALPAAELARIFGVSGALPNVESSWNVAPTNRRPVVRRHPETGERRLDLLTWGLVPRFTKDLKGARKPINARAETVTSSGMFRSAFASRRCLVPADLFYEWKAEPGGKQPFAIGRRDGMPLAFGGVWESWTQPDATVLRTYAIITTAANQDMVRLHDRMPLVLGQDDWAAWLEDDTAGATGLLHAPPSGTLRLWPVARDVNNVRHNGAALIAPVPEGAGTQPRTGANSA